MPSSLPLFALYQSMPRVLVARDEFTGRYELTHFRTGLNFREHLAGDLQISVL
jgi:hypothetical protein